LSNLRNTIIKGGSLTIKPRDILRGDNTQVTIRGYIVLFKINREDKDALLNLFKDLPGLNNSLLRANNTSFSIQAIYTKLAKKDKLEKSKKTF
jgi:hypothetical protein